MLCTFTAHSAVRDTEYVHVRFDNPMILLVDARDTNSFIIRGSTVKTGDTIIIGIDHFEETSISQNLFWRTDTISKSVVDTTGIQHLHWSAKNGSFRDSFYYKISTIDIVNVTDTDIDPTLGETMTIRLRTSLDDTITVYSSYRTAPRPAMGSDAYIGYLQNNFYSETTTLLQTTANQEKIFVWNGKRSDGSSFPSGADAYLTFKGSTTTQSIEALDKNQRSLIRYRLGKVLFPKNAERNAVNIKIK